LYYALRNDNWPTNKKCNVYAQRLFGLVFNDNDDIFNNTDCAHIDRYRWNNRAITLCWVTPTDNMNNRGVCLDKIDRKHDKTIIIYLEKWIDYVTKVKFENIKNKKTKNDEQEKKKQDKIIWMEDYIQSLNKDLETLKNEMEN
jgi:hypothetical protein